MNPDIRALDLNLLKALDALLDERSVTRAADRLSLTQPAVSGMLNRLRESFDDVLFVRAQRGIVPTLRAEQLATPVKQLLADIESMLRPQAFNPLTACMTVKVASTDYALRAVVVPFLNALRKQAPNVRVSIQPVDGHELVAQLDRGDIDLVLITPENMTPGLHAVPLFDETTSVRCEQTIRTQCKAGFLWIVSAPLITCWFHLREAASTASRMMRWKD
ncbi:Transcriptional regulator, LysR family [Pseudomonas syringae pv. viburni]|uniref:Transcriptional regulator, LysR family n=1 Tax=Pseudomonas syringae pv. viburni TaxID=251703 RepID=A0A0Q0CYZ3_9PSED|nr:LysR family transcriptional regulator [Pseudomonas syringae group genomosp. 3]KPZ18958.1 Transcriptional regulator, LysR family [Pseudomonas syringae pv. viburni]